VWIATVENIDWPSSNDLSTDAQKMELIELFDAAAALHLNAVILQIRPAADALYSSDIEPWSRYLTGMTGRPPSPHWDPLAFAVAEAHARGLELHAWFNPFRASTTTKEIADPSHITRSQPDLVVSYGTKKWLDPGLPAARAHSLRVIADVVRRYDIDAVHVDDYFYPYVEQDAAGRNIPFPDESTYARYRDAGGDMSLGDWRRNNINTFVRDMYNEVHRTKPWVQVGISPFGIWRPGNPPSVRGLDAYAEIYADARTWLRNGWLDYIAPQMYWLTDAPGQKYTDLTEWWVGENVMGREVEFGNAPFNTARPGWSIGEITRQVELTRGLPGASGNIYFSAKNILRDNNGLRELLAADAYRTQALLPELPWIAAAPAPAPRARIATDERAHLISLDWSHEQHHAHVFLLRTRTNGVWSMAVVPGNTTVKALSYGATPPDVIALSVIARNGVEGPAQTFVRN
jgi:uncharacterized lipoprotein YddW (UPF0748 family)